MRVALGSDESSELTDALASDLRARGFDVVLFGALAAGQDSAWPHVGHEVGNSVARGECRFGIVCCWTGTGVSIAANKVSGVRAALCNDAETAAGARTWNDANVLALSLRSTSIPVARAILDAWFSGAPTQDPNYMLMIGRVEESKVGPGPL